MHNMLVNDRPKRPLLGRGLAATRALVQEIGAKRARWLAPLAPASSRRYWASQRQRLSDAAQNGMRIVIVAAVLDILVLTPVGHDAARPFILTNVAIAVAAIVAIVVISRQWRRSPVLPVVAVLTLIDLGTARLGLAYPEMHLVLFGYLLLLPTVVALVIPWSTRVHGAWLLMHMALTVAYLMMAAVPAHYELRTELALLAVSSGVSLYGHFAGYHSRVGSFVNTNRINALNRQAGRDQFKLAALNTVLDLAARTDALTGLKNRLALKDDLLVLRSRIKRHGERFVLMLADLDHFKGINDHLGHVAGDAVLQAVAGRLAVSFRPEDGVYRFGGEEFVLLMKSTPSTAAGDVAERARQSIASLDLAHPANPPHDRVTISVGALTVGTPELALDDDAWFRRADQALYQAKADGRDRSVVWVRPEKPAAAVKGTRLPLVPQPAGHSGRVMSASDTRP